LCFSLKEKKRVIKIKEKKTKIYFNVVLLINYIKIIEKQVQLIKVIEQSPADDIENAINLNFNFNQEQEDTNLI